MTGGIFLDVDGTLLSFRTHEIPASALDALTRAHRRGVRLFIATGRAVGELDFPVGVELDEGIFVNRVTPVVRELAELVAHPVPEVTDLRALFGRTTCCQICFYLDPELERRVMAQLPALVSSRWCPLFVDVNLRGIDKATGLREMAAHFGLEVSETMAFGDGGNDAPMLRAAGIGVAMGNGCGEALQAADYVTSSVDDDGILRALEHFGVI